MILTKASIASDIILRISKGQPSDDLEIEPSQILFWFDAIAAEQLPLYYNKKLKDNSWLSLSPDAIITEDNKVATLENVTMLEDCKDRVFITLDKPVLELWNDLGIVRIINNQGQVVNKVSIERLDSINKLTFGRPSRENLLYTRVGSKIYIHGVKPVNIKLVQFSVYYIPKVDTASLGPTDEIKMPQDIFNTILDMVYEKALREIAGVADLESDAEDDTTAN